APCAALACFLFVNTLCLQDARGESALSAGLLTLPMAAMILVFAPVSGQLVARRGPRLPLTLAGVAILVGSLLLLPLHAHTALPRPIVGYVVFGIGIGLLGSPISNTAVSG